MNSTTATTSQVGLDQLKNDASVVSIIETFPTLKGRENSSTPLKHYVVFDQSDRYSRTLKQNGKGYFLESRLPFQDFEESQKRVPSSCAEDFFNAKVEYDPKNRFQSVMNRTSFRVRKKDPLYSTDVRYLAYRKICRIFEDGKKQLNRNDRIGAQLLLGICLLHLARYFYIHQNRPIPSLGKITQEIQKGMEPLSSILRNFPSESQLSESYDRIASLLQQYQGDYPWESWKWESKPLRFGKRFSFEGLVFSESENPIWKIRNLLWKSPPRVLPWFQKHQERVSQCQDFQEIREALVEILKQIPTVEGALIMGSQAQASSTVQTLTGSDLDLVLFVKGLYLKRFFFMMGDIPLDGVVLSGRVAELGVQHSAAMAVNGFANGSVIFDPTQKYSKLAESAKDRYRQGPPSVLSSEIDFALLRMQVMQNQYGFSEEETATGIRFLFLEQFVNLVRSISRALGIWFVGEQKILPFLEEKDPEIVQGIGKIFDQYAKDPGEALQDFILHIRHRFRETGFPRIAVSHERFSIDQLFDY